MSKPARFLYAPYRLRRESYERVTIPMRVSSSSHYPDRRDGTSLFVERRTQGPVAVGDIFGAVNALFSGFAFAGLFLQSFCNIEELKLQREDLRQQREELSLTRAEFERQNATLAAQRFEGAFFQMMRMHGENVLAMRVIDNWFELATKMFSILRNTFHQQYEYIFAMNRTAQ